MQIILLSGGSGKRLWPLSNGTRSKQFLQLLQSPTGEPESMVQRVARQIAEAHLTSHITFATSETQRDSILSQLADGVDIVTEPKRRDTFPAIALSTGYLALEKGCPRDEVVVVMPCDCYTDSGYFETIRQMVTCVEQSVVDLVLMGVTPTYASTKYGYVVPVAEDTNYCKRVNKFAEKPTVERAEELLQQGAYWNGGVFAFRLGYILDILTQYITVDSFAELRSRYAEFPKISFDYEVVEKATSVAVVPFTGMWRDLGTWNALVEELPCSTIGNVILGEQSTNSMVINELSIPLVCNGVDNVIVAASYDGILVCSKESSEHIKPYVEPIDSRPMLEQRRWGSYKVINNVTYADGTCSLTKELNLHPGCHISYQVHHHRDEIWTFVDGEGLLVIDGKTIHVTRGDVYSIKKEQHHAVKAITPLQIIEVQVGNPLIEEDIERFDWDWNE